MANHHHRVALCMKHGVPNVFVVVRLNSSSFFLILSLVAMMDLFNGLKQDNQASVVSASDIWTIDGKHYDLRRFLQRHPGGNVAIDLGRGQDCTTLFHSYHTNLTPSSVHLKILSACEVPDQSLPAELKVRTEPMSSVDSQTVSEATGSSHKSAHFVVGRLQSESLADDTLYQDLKAEVNRYARETFGRPASEALKMPISRGVLALAGFSLHLIALQSWLRSGSIWAGVLAALGNLVCAMQLSHDGSHFAVSRHPWLNELSAWTALPFIFHPRLWYAQHVLQHHVFTNDRADVDLVHLSPLGRLSPLLRWRPRYRLNALAATLLLPSAATFAESIHYPARLLLAFLRGRLHRARLLAGLSDRVSFLFGSISKVAMYLGALAASIVPLAYVWIHFSALAALTPFLVSGSWFFAITQVSHLQPECQDPRLEAVDPDTGHKVLSWSHRQLLHTVDYQPDSLFWNIASGGLNAQSLHHLFPTIHAAHFPALWPRLQAVAARHGVRISTRRSLWHALCTWAEWMQTLGKHQQVPLDAYTAAPTKNEIIQSASKKLAP